MFTAGWVSGRRPKTGEGCGRGPCPLQDYWRRRIGEGTPSLAAVNPSLGGGARQRSALRCHCQLQREVTLTKGGTMTVLLSSFATNDRDYKVETYDDIKKRRGHGGGGGGRLRHSPSSCRHRWWRSWLCASRWWGTRTAIAGGGSMRQAVKLNRHCWRGGRVD
jgi:hypothetical protein